MIFCIFFKEAKLLSEIQNFKKLYEEEKKENDEYHALLRIANEESKEKDLINNNLMKELRLKEMKLAEQVQKSDSNQIQIRGFKRTLDETLDQLAKLRTQTIALVKEKDDLVFENNGLKEKLGLGSEALTPRPNYKKIMEERKVDLGIKVDPFWASKTSSLAYNV